MRLPVPLRHRVPPIHGRGFRSRPHVGQNDRALQLTRQVRSRRSCGLWVIVRLARCGPRSTAAFTMGVVVASYSARSLTNCGCPSPARGPTARSGRYGRTARRRRWPWKRGSVSGSRGHLRFLNTSSKARVYLASRSWIRNPTLSSRPSIARLRVCWATQRPFGFGVTPTIGPPGPDLDHEQHVELRRARSPR